MLFSALCLPLKLVGEDTNPLGLIHNDKPVPYIFTCKFHYAKKAIRQTKENHSPLAGIQN